MCCYFNYFFFEQYLSFRIYTVASSSAWLNFEFGAILTCDDSLRRGIFIPLTESSIVLSDVIFLYDSNLLDRLPAYEFSERLTCPTLRAKTGSRFYVSSTRTEKHFSDSRFLVLLPAKFQIHGLSISCARIPLNFLRKAPLWWKAPEIAPYLYGRGRCLHGRVRFLRNSYLFVRNSPQFARNISIFVRKSTVSTLYLYGTTLIFYGIGVSLMRQRTNVTRTNFQCYLPSPY